MIQSILEVIVVIVEARHCWRLFVEEVGVVLSLGSFVGTGVGLLPGKELFVDIWILFCECSS